MLSSKQIDELANEFAQRAAEEAGDNTLSQAFLEDVQYALEYAYYDSNPPLDTVEDDGTRYRIFVYGTLKRGYHNHGFVEDQTFIGEARTTDPGFIMVDAGVPFVFSVPDHITACHIRGEVYEVDEATMRAVDRLEANGSLYQRYLVDTEPHGEAWMYLGLKPERMGVFPELEAARFPTNATLRF